MYYRGLFFLIALLFCPDFQISAQKKNKTENIILITLDGFRWRELFTGADAGLMQQKEFVADPESLKALFGDEDPLIRRKKLLPFIWGTLATQGQVYGNPKFQNLVNLRNKHHFSYPGYNEILTGLADDDRIKSNDKIYNPNKTVLEFINQQQGFRQKVAAFGSWDVFPYIINTQRSGLPVNAGFALAPEPLTSREKFLNQLQGQIPSPWASVRLDAFTHHYAFEYIKKNSPRVVYIAYGETDDFAHDGHYDAYLKSAHQTDSFIKDLWTWVQQSPAYKNKTTLLITTDHGRGMGNNDWRNHGANVSESEQTWLMVLGPDTPALGEVKQPQQLYTNQLAATLAALLGLNYTATQPVGKVIESVMHK